MANSGLNSGARWNLKTRPEGVGQAEKSRSSYKYANAVGIMEPFIRAFITKAKEHATADDLKDALTHNMGRPRETLAVT